jgi:putative two-component system response regulator
MLETISDADGRTDQTGIRLPAIEVDLAHRLARIAEFRDYPDGAHVERVGRLAEILGARVGMAEADLTVIRLAAPLHDIGKIAIPDDILLKPAPLTMDELDIAKSHTTVGARLLDGSPSPILKMAADIALYHHENWDGTGYTPGIRQENIPLAGRIVSVADVFDALTHPRPYKQAWSSNDALEWILSMRARKFDPSVVDALMAAMPEIEADPMLSDEWISESDRVDPLPAL